MKSIISCLVLVLISISISAQKPYRGAEVYSNDEVVYGKFVMNMKMIKGSGMLSTFFTYKGSSYQEGVFWEEIDIEVLGKDNAEIMSTNIITDGVTGDEDHSTEEVNPGYSLADDYHTYTLVWAPDSIVWYIDDVLQRKETGSVTALLTSPEGYRLNAWISCSPEWVGPIDEEALPQYQYVEWIEYYSYDNGAFTFEWRDDFTTFDDARWSKADWSFDCNEVQFTPDNAYIEDEKLVLALTDPNPSTGTNSPIDETNFTVINNQTLGQLELFFSKEGQYYFQLFDLTGKIVFDGRVYGKETSVSYLGLSAGTYFIRVRSNDIYSTKQLYVK